MNLSASTNFEISDSADSKEEEARAPLKPLKELRKKPSDSNFENLLQTVESDLKTGRKGRESLEKLRHFIFKSCSPSFEDLTKMAVKLKNEFPVRALILYHISSDLRKTQNVDPNNAVNWIRNHVLEVMRPTELLVTADENSRDVGLNYGLALMETLLSELRAAKNVCPRFRALNEASCLVSITAIYDDAGEYQKVISTGLNGITLLEKQFSREASKHQCYGMLLNNIGVGYHNLGQYSSAKVYYNRALSAKEKASDFDYDTEKRGTVELTNRNLHRLHR